MNIQWYPGHMTKTRRQIEADLGQVDMVAEIMDARIPVSSRNPDIDAIVGNRPRLVIFNRFDQADPEASQLWEKWFRRKGCALIETDASTGKGVRQFTVAARELLKERIERWRAKGLVGRPIRAMVVGVPNVGKSTFINQVAGRKSAQVGDRPGVTRGRQWIAVDQGLDLLDTPGILWPKFEDERVGLHLAYTGAVKDDVMDMETLACRLMDDLAAWYPHALTERYRIDLPAKGKSDSAAYGYELLRQAGARRGFRRSGGEIDTERMARVLLDEFRSGRMGRFTLELPREEA